MNDAADQRVPPPFLFVPSRGRSPLVVSVPHAGRHYPPELDAARGAAWSLLHDLEDRYADRLVAGAVRDGAAAVVATHARAWIDLNRDERDRGGAPISPHGRAGLGIVPLRLGGRALWRRPPGDDAVAARIVACHRPYHAAVAAALHAARARHGFALLIDCHSMPPLENGRGPRIVVGDRRGASADPAIAEAVAAAARARGFTAARNAPYAGAHTVERHGDPAGGVHAIQIELDRSLYLAPGLREPSADLANAIELLAALCAAALAATIGLAGAVAAE